MVETVFLSGQQQKILSILITLSLIISQFSTSLVFIFSDFGISQEKDDSIKDSLQNTLVHIPKLMKQKSSNPELDSYVSGNNHSEISELDSNNKLTSNFAIGSQNGVGGGNYIVNDSLNLTNSEAIAISNTIASPETRQDDFTITVPNGFTNRSGIFNITNVKAEFDVRAIEDDESLSLYVDSDDGGNGWYEVAMQFNVTEDYVNLSSLYVRIVSEQVGFDVPSGELLLVNSSWDSVNSRWKPNGTEVLSTISLGTSTGWTIPPLTFSENITLRGDRNYFIILNDTTPAGNNAYWKWGVQRDLTSVGGDSIDEGAFYYKWLTHAEDSWTYGTSANQLDLNLVISVLPVEKSGGDYFQKTYSDPTEIELLYNTSVDETNLTRFNWFEWNATSDNIHRFRTNTSVSFDLAWIINLTSVNNPLTVSASYLTTNNTVTHWNLTFSTDSVTTSYSIRNRTITINGLENDWNGTAIYLDGTLEYNSTPSGGFNTSITYSNQSSAMIINTSTLAIATDWIASFDAPNYLLNITLSREGNVLSLPYRTFIMNDYNLTFKVGETGNLTYWIDYPNESKVLQKTNIDDIHTTITDLWEINKTLDQTTNINGTYSLQGFWENNEKTKVGTFTRTLDLLINTSLTVYGDIQVVIGQLFNVTAYYTSIHNDSQVKNAKIFCESNWTNNVYMNQVNENYYNASFDTNDRSAGQNGTVTITTMFPWFVNWTKQVSVSFIGPTSIEARDAVNNTLLINGTSTYYRKYSASYSDNFSIIVCYYDEKTTTFLNVITDPLVESDGSILVYKKKDPISYNWTFEFNGSAVGSFLINITFNLEDYVPATFQIRYVIRKADASIISEIDKTNIPWNNSYDFALVVNNTNHNENITLYTDAEIDINDTTKVQFLNQQGDRYWFRFAPTTLPIETYNINITFSHSYVQSSFVILTFSVINRPANVEARDAVNNTLLINGTSVYYRKYSDSYSDNFSIIVSYYDQETTATLNVTTDPIIESDLSILVYKWKDPISYNWTFEFNGSEIGSFLINISFSLDNYTSVTFQIQYVIIKAQTEVISEIAETYILWNNSYDFALVVNNTNHNENITLYTDAEIDINDTTKVQFLNQQGDKYWFRFAPTALPLGIHDINITFFHSYFHNSSIIASFTVIKRPTGIEARDALDNTLLANETSTYSRQYSEGHSDTFSIILGYYDEETEIILNSTSDPNVESDGSILVYATKDPISYNWTFVFNGTAVGNFLINITFTLNNYTASTFQIRYLLSKANTAVISEISQTTF
ncbi:MAG: hypothetical protein ACFFB5_05220, partial [Promethearchaeota archaeon]